MSVDSRGEEATNPGGAGLPAPPDTVLFRGPLSALSKLDQITYWIIVAVMAAMSLVLAAQVVARYGFDASFDAGTELARLFFVWSIFLAIPHGIKHGVHVGIDVFVKLLPYRVQSHIFRAVAAASTTLMGVLLYFSVIATAEKWQELMPTLPITAAMYYIPVVIACGHSTLHLLALVAGGPRTWEGIKR